MFELKIKEYPIPYVRTTYVDFVFNLPEDLTNIVHIVYGDAIISQPQHLNHFLGTGCPERFNESLVGIPTETSNGECNVLMGGFAGWAPGVIMWDMSTNVRVPNGSKFGIKLFLVNTHYTNGDVPYLNGDQVIATDGIRVFYKTDLRPKMLEGTPLINILFGPEEMVILPNRTCELITRTCTVQFR